MLKHLGFLVMVGLWAIGLYWAMAQSAQTVWWLQVASMLPLTGATFMLGLFVGRYLRRDRH